MGVKFSVRKVFLILLALTCLAITGWTSYLLYDGKITPLVGGIILTVGVGVLIWNISVLSKYRVGAWTIVSICLVIALLGATVGAFAGVKPFSDAKDAIIKFFSNIQTETLGETKFATVENIHVSSFGSLWVDLKPTKSALPNKIYIVELYENGSLRDTIRVSWNQPELNVLKTKTVKFPLTQSEFNAYWREDVSNIFTIKVREWG